MARDRDRPITAAMWELGEVIWNARYDLSRGARAGRPPWPDRENYEHHPIAAVDLCLAEAAAVLEHFQARGLRIVPLEPTSTMVKAASKPIPHLRAEAGEEPGPDDWISNKEKHRLRWRTMIEHAPKIGGEHE